MRLLKLMAVLFVGLVGVFDTVLTLVYWDGMIEREQNTVSRMIMQTQGLMSFVQIKAALTLLVVCILIGLAFSRYGVVVWAVAAFQVCLLWFLLFADDSSREYSHTSSPAQDALEFYATGGRNLFWPEYWPSDIGIDEPHN